MHFLDYNENKQCGTYEFPFEFYHVDQQHPQYIMSYHWHIEYELIRILKGEFKNTMDEKEFIAHEGDVIFVNSGTLHAGIPFACVYECIVFDPNAFLKHNASCQKLIQNIIDHSILIFHHFKPNRRPIHDIIWNVFDAMRNKPYGYELIVFGELYHFFGVIYENNYYLKDAPQTRSTISVSCS